MATILTSINSPMKTQFTPEERDAIYRLRVMLKDLPDDTYRSLGTLVEEQRGERWTDEMLLVYINQAAADINSSPPHTYYTVAGFPVAWNGCLMLGALIKRSVTKVIL